MFHTFSEKMLVDQLHQNSNEKLRQSVDDMPQLVWLCNADGEISYVNAFALQFFNVPSVLEFTPAFVGSLFHPGDLNILGDIGRKAIALQERHVTECRLRRHDNTYLWHMIAAQPLVDKNGELSGWYITGIDINDLRTTQQLLDDRENEFRTTLDSITDAVVRLDTEWRLVYANQEAVNLLEKPMAAMLNRSIWTIFPQLIGSPADVILREAFETQQPLATEQRISASKTVLEVRVKPSPQGLTVYFRDITHSILTANQLRMLETCIAKLNEAVVISEIDSETGDMTEIIYVNSAFENILGYSRDDLAGTSWLKSNSAPNQQQSIKRISSSILNRETVNSELIVVRADKSEITIEIDVVPLTDQSHKRCCVSLIRDISERKEAALALSRSNRALQMYSACNEILVRAQTEKELLTQVCRAVVDIGAYGSAWIDYKLNDKLQTLRGEASALASNRKAPPPGYSQSWNENHPNACGPSARCLNGGVSVVVEDISAYPGEPMWKAAALDRQEGGMICLPLKNGSQTFGVMTLYTLDVRPVDHQELKLLSNLGDDISFGISNIRAQNERRRMQAAVISIATGVTTASSSGFFQTLALNLQQALGTNAAVICTLPATGASDTMSTTMAAVIEGIAIPNFSFDLHHSPCERFMRGEVSVISAMSNSAFVATSTLGGLSAKTFFGCRIDGPDGTPLGILFVLLDEDGSDASLILSTLQIFASSAAGEIERRKADTHIRQQASLLDQARDAIILCDFAGDVKFWNKGAERNYGWRADEVMGRSMSTILGDEGEQIKNAFAAIRAKGEWMGEIVRSHKDGSRVIAECRWTLAKSDGGDLDSILAIETDITRRKAAENEIEHLAFFDQLTGLPNRMMLMERLEHTVKNLNGAGGALLFVDLDNFKDINDNLGHDIGDKMLIEVARRLSAVVRKSDIVARSGSDEFVIILDHLSSDIRTAAEQAASVADKLLQTLSNPFRLTEKDHMSTSSIGITLFDDPTANVGEFVKRADLAMYQAKNAGRNTICFFDPEIHAAVTARAVLEADFRQSLSESNFVLFYQPQLHQDGRVLGAEALIRWPHPERGLVPPNEFIPLAEETGLIHPLGYWVLETAWNQLEQWSKIPGSSDLVLAVNVSSRQFRHPDFVDRVISLISDKRADPRRLKLELTESLLLDDIDATVKKMRVLKEYGVSFSLDDFGTGYSSLSYLKRLPLDQLKIDQSFIKDILHNDSNEAAIACTIVALAQSLGLDVIAEGVETTFQREFLSDNGCAAYQGYLISRPLPIDKFERFLSGEASSDRIIDMQLVEKKVIEN